MTVRIYAFFVARGVTFTGLSCEQEQSTENDCDFFHRGLVGDLSHAG